MRILKIFLCIYVIFLKELVERRPKFSGLRGSLFVFASFGGQPVSIPVFATERLAL